MHLSRNISLFWVSLQSHIFSLHILTGTDPSWNWFFMRRPLPCVPAQAVVHWRLEVKTPEFQETRQACSSPWIKGETGKGTQSGLNCSSVEKDLFPTLHTVIWNWTPQAWGNMLRMNGCVLWLSPGVHRVKSSGRRALGLLQRTRLCTLQARAIAGEADETLTDAPSRRI